MWTPYWKQLGTCLILVREPSIEVDLAIVQSEADFNSTMRRIGAKRLQPDEVSELAILLFECSTSAREAEKKEEAKRYLMMLDKIRGLGAAAGELGATGTRSEFGYGESWGRWIYCEGDIGQAGVWLDGESYPVLLEQLTSRDELARLAGHMASKDEFGPTESKDVVRALVECFQAAELPPELERTPQGIRRRK